jgi:hypothetical protein
MGTEKSRSFNQFDRLAESLCAGNKQLLVEQIAETFHQVSAHLPSVDPDDPLLKNIIDVPDESLMSVSQVKRRFEKLAVNKAPGPDGIPPWILKEYAEFLATPYTSIFCKSLRVMPRDFKF